MWPCFPPCCEKCAALQHRPGSEGTPKYWAGTPPHEDLVRLTDWGYCEGGVELYQCRSCQSFWEFISWAYFPQEWALQRVPPVASLEEWRDQQRRAMQPSTARQVSLFLVGCSVLLGFFAAVVWLSRPLFF